MVENLFKVSGSKPKMLSSCDLSSFPFSFFFGLKSTCVKRGKWRIHKLLGSKASNAFVECLRGPNRIHLLTHTTLDG